MNLLADDTGIKDRIFSVNAASFEELALELFRYQYASNATYRSFCDHTGRNPASVNSLEQIPFLPISFFKTQQIIASAYSPSVVFESSGTTGSINSKHYVADPNLYKESFLRTFTQFYGDPVTYCVLGLLPSYLERQHSSLVYMVDDLIHRSKHPSSGFYLYDTQKLYDTLLANESAQQPTLLIGVTYALLDFAEQFPMQLKHTIVMETGGMKGRRTEITREQVHAILTQQWGLAEVHSEYGMTELLSQAYAKQKGIFSTPPWMKVVLRAEDDPFEIMNEDALQPVSGAINVIDLANLYSCSFIATDDAGKLYPGGNFEVLGRLDNSDTRGCGLMVV